MKNIFFFGIGGIGISALARMFLLEGDKVSGSDISASLITRELEKAGASVFIGQDIKQIPKNTDLIVYTVALTELAPELFAELKKLKIPLRSYPEMLGQVSKEKYTIAISGTHGKTTTTAMVGKVLKDAGFDPTIIVGSLLKNEKSNFVAGKSKYLVVEADEYRRAFINLNPKILVITNIDEDHLDYFKDIADIQSAFAELAARLPKDGILINNFSDLSLPKDFKLKVPGKHNIENAKAALAVAQALNIPEAAALKSLSEFEGTWRRFEFKGTMPKGALVYDDYAHNPHKVRAALQGAREMFPEKKIIAVFQPHLYSRTKSLFNDFAKSFDSADEVILLPIYAARERFDSTISSDMLAREIGNHTAHVRLASDMDHALDLVMKSDSPDSLVMTIGAGDVTLLSDRLIK